MPVKADHRRRRLKTLRMILILGCVLFLAPWLIKNPCLCVQGFFDRIPKDPAMAAAVMLILYLLKGLTIFFPLIVLEIASGYLFSGWTALLVIFSGILIILTVPYWVGRAAGMEAVHKQVKKHPRFEKILSMQQQNSFFLCFFLRIISCLPGDVVTMYLGATRTSFWKNILAGSLGLLPGMVLATFMGESVQQPQSPAFWISVGLMLTLSASSAAAYFLYCRKGKRRAKTRE